MSRFLSGQTPGELAETALSLGEKKFRGRQLADFLYHRFEQDIAAMHTLPAAFRARLAEAYPSPACRELGRVETSDGATKLLLGLADGEAIEMVLIPAADGRRTFCLSTQVGCPVRCAFCASGENGLKRNLEAGEITGEFLLGAHAIGRVPDNVVFMGIGEGLLNFEALRRTLELLTSPDAVGMSPRRITVSTSGYVPGIRKLAAMGREFTLAISLHAPDDALRAKLIPSEVRYPIEEILAAADEYLTQAGRMVTLEYVLLAGVNDSEAQASALAKLARAHRAKVNLIPYNPTPAALFARPQEKVIARFERILADSGCHVTVRRSKGADANAACGQLANSRRS